MRAAAVPFRWNVSNPRLYRRLGRGPRPQVPTGFKDDLLRCAGLVLRAAGDADLVFVGRSLESVHDLLLGALETTSWRDRLQLLQLSLRQGSPGALRRERPGALGRLWAYADALALTPERLLARPRPVAFVDVVFGGRTFGSLLRVLRHWSGGPPARWRRVRARLRFVAVVERDHPRWEPWDPSWVAWTRQLEGRQLQRVPIGWRLWRYLADDQPKTTDPHLPTAWGSGAAQRAPTEADRLAAARLARALYRQGRWARGRLAAELERPPRPEPWRAGLIAELRR